MRGDASIAIDAMTHSQNHNFHSCLRTPCLSGGTVLIIGISYIKIAVLSLKTSVKLILHHKKAIAAVWILLILFPNTMILLAEVYRFYEMPTKPTNDVKLVAASLRRNGSGIEQYVDAHVQCAYDFQVFGAVRYLPRRATC